MRRKQQAFTLIELMVTLVVLGIALGIAIPSFNELIRTNRSLAIGEDLSNALNFARAEAVKRNGRVSICASNNGIGCVGSWSQGWIIFVDTALSDFAAAPIVIAANVLRVSNTPDNGAVIMEENNKTFIRYTGSGMLARLDDKPISLYASMENCTSNGAQQVSVSLSGSVSVLRVPCDTGEEE